MSEQTPVPRGAVAMERVPEQWRAASFSIAEESFDDSVTILTVEGELDISTVGMLRERLDTAIRRGAERLVVDLSTVGFLDSVSLAVLVAAGKRLNGRLATVVAPDSYSRLIFEVTGVSESLGVVETRDQARAAMRT
jgi:anti-anti-sigma factor